MKKTLIAALITMSLSTVTHAAVTETWSDAFLSFNNYYTSDDTTSGDFLYLDDVEIVGLDAFDSSLGTLEGISVTINADFDVMADLYSVDQLGSPASIDVMGLADITLELVAWNPTLGTGSPNFLEYAFPTDSLSCIFDDFSECVDGLYEITVVSSTIDITSTVNLADFMDTGMLDPALLTLGVIYPQALAFTLDNAGFAEVDTYVDGFADITVAYSYSPVPLPGAVWLMSSGLLMLAGASRRRRK